MDIDPSRGDVFYNFDIAVELLMKSYGEKNVMNNFFMAAYKTGWPSNTLLAVRSDYLMDRLVYDDQPEKRFWAAVYNCYCLDRAKHMNVLNIMLHAVKKAAEVDNLGGQSQTMYAALKADVQFYEPNNWKEIHAAIDRDTNGGKVTYPKIYELVEKFINGGYGTSEHGRNKVELSRAINKNEEDSSPITCMKAFRAIFNGMELTEKTKDIPYGCQMMFLRKGGDEFKNFLNGIKSDNHFGHKYYNSNLGRALYFMWTKRKESGAEAYHPIIARYLRLLFYINVDQQFLKYLGEFRANHNLVANPALAMWLGPVMNGRDAYHISKMDERPALQFITEHVQTWDAFHAIRSNQNPMGVARRIHGPTGGTSGGSGVSG